MAFLQRLRIPVTTFTHSEGKRSRVPAEGGHPLNRSEATTRDRSLTALGSRFRVG
jgi:hypothetical protein